MKTLGPSDSNRMSVQGPKTLIRKEVKWELNHLGLNIIHSSIFGTFTARTVLCPNDHSFYIPSQYLEFDYSQI